MDLVRQLRDVRFETAVRGYDYAGVDTFLATLRSDVADLQAVSYTHLTLPTIYSV